MARGEIDWPAVRLDYEAGVGVRELARRYGIGSAGTISKRAAGEGWMRPVQPVETATETGKETPVSLGVSKGVSNEGNGADEDDGPLGDDGIPLKQRRFAEEFIIDLNGTQAAIRAGYSPASAESQGSRLLRNAKVAALVEQLRKERSARVQIEADDVVRRLYRLMDADVRKAFRWGVRPADGQEGDAGDGGQAGEIYMLPVDSRLLDDATAAGISEIALTKHGLRVRMIDRVRVGSELLKHLPKPADASSDPGDTAALPVNRGKGLSGLLAEMRKHQAQRADAESQVVVYLPDNGRDDAPV